MRPYKTSVQRALCLKPKRPKYRKREKEGPARDFLAGLYMDGRDIRDRLVESEWIEAL